MMESMLVTGATGFVGKHLHEYLRANYPDIEVFGLTRSDNLSKQSGLVNCDLYDRFKLTEVLAELSPSYIIHLAGATPPKISGRALGRKCGI